MRTLLRTVVRFTRLNVWKIMPMRERISRSCRVDAWRTLTPSIADVARRERHEPVDGADERGLAGAREARR